MKTSDTEMPSKNTPFMKGLKLVAHPTLIKKKYRSELMRSADLIIEEGSDAYTSKAELTLFRALHACEYELSRVSTRQRTDIHIEHVQRLQRNIVDYLVASHTGLVYEMRSRHVRVGCDEDEYISAGFWCLHQSVMAFDPWRGFRFSTYACNAILRGYSGVWKRKRARRRRFDHYVHLNFQRVSSEGYHETYDQVDDAVLREHLSGALQLGAAQLTPTERFVISQRFLVKDRQSAPTLATVGKLIQLSKERVRQIQIGALAKLRNALQDDPTIHAVLESA